MRLAGYLCVKEIILIYTRTSTLWLITIMGIIMNIHIIGAGSLGLLYAGKLADSGCRVTLWCRSEEQADKLRASGITIEEPGRQEVVDAHALGQLMVILCRVGWRGRCGLSFPHAQRQGIEEMATEMLALFGQDHRRLLCFQNGTGHLERLQGLPPMWTLYSAITTEGAKRTSGVSVLHAGHGTTTIGKMKPAGSPIEAFSQEDHENKLVKQLNRAGFEAFCRMKWMR